MISQALIRAANSGDRASIDQLLAAVEPDIRRYARRSCRQASDVDDAAQDALWLVARRVGTLRAIASFSAWLMAIVRRECLRLARRAIGVHAPLETIDNDARFATRNSEELRLDLAAAIQSLPEHYRRVILLRDIEERTIDEIALAESLSRESVKARLHRARVLVREFLLE